MSDPAVHGTPVPMPEGVTSVGRVSTPDRPWRSIPEYSLGSNISLADLRHDFSFLSHGALFLYGGFPFDPLDEFLRELPADEAKVYRLELGYPIVSNLQDNVGDNKGWNQRVFLIPKHLTDRLGVFLSTAAIVDRAQKYLCKIDLWQVPFVAKDDPATQLPLMFTCLLSNLHTVSLIVPRPISSTNRCTVQVLPANPDFVSYATAILQDHDRPLADTIEHSRGAMERIIEQRRREYGESPYDQLPQRTAIFGASPISGVYRPPDVWDKCERTNDDRRMREQPDILRGDSDAGKGDGAEGV